MSKDSIFEVVKGREAHNLRHKYYIRATIDGIVTYHRYKEKFHTWKAKYYPYGGVKSEAGSATFYNVGRTVDLFDVEETGIILPNTSVAIGYNF